MDELQEFARLGKTLTDGILALLSSALGLDPSSPEYLTKMHSHSNNSGTHVRLLKSPANSYRSTPHLQPHTDWGTLTVLFNALGGLQLYMPETVDAANPGWRSVKPEPGTAIINLGDAMVVWSDGEFKSNIHRVMQPPGDQRMWARYSLAYFTRPDNDVLLRPLGRKQLPSNNEQEFPTFKEWALRRAMAGMADNYKKDNWEKGQGTETVMSTAARETLSV
jgi:isopenicillin N synthase-like dioxygenase